MRRIRIPIILTLLLVVAGAYSGRFLVIDAPQKSDVIVVLAGDTDRRPERGFELLDQGFAAHLLLDVPAGGRIYGSTEPELAQRWLERLPHADAMNICPTNGLSTKIETRDVERCLEGHGWHSVLIVTSDFHTRRAWSTFRRQLPAYQFRVAASHNDPEFGVDWWRHRQWAKVNLDEWLRLIWWYLVDRWL
jgi:uncharacterized SAM-binding protein YcdF (DUF218 family)